VTTTDAICNCVENAERQVRTFSQRVQWTPLLLVVSMFACENTHSVALGLAQHTTNSKDEKNLYIVSCPLFRLLDLPIHLVLKKNCILYL